MFDLKVIQTVLTQLEEERGIPKAKILEAIELALATAYKKEYGKRGQIVRTTFNVDSGAVEFTQVKMVINKDQIYMDEEDAPEYDASTPEEDRLVRYDEEKHMFVEDARFIKRDAKVGDEVVFPLEIKDDYGRIAAQTAKQVIVQKIREAEKVSVLAEYGEIEGTIVSGTVERVERGTIFVDMGRAIGMLAYNEQIPGERYKQGERMRAYLVRVEETARGVFLRLSRSHPKFLEKLFEAEVPEIAGGTVEVKAIAREAGMRSKIAVFSHDEHVDPVGALVGQQGVRVQTIMAELHGEKIDIVEWSPDTEEFIHDALSPAKVIEVELNEQMQSAKIFVTEDQQSLAIGKGGQNARLAAKLTGWKIDISSIDGDKEVDDAKVEISEEKTETIEASETPTAEEAPEEASEAAETEEVTEEAPATEKVEDEK